MSEFSKRGLLPWKRWYKSPLAWVLLSAVALIVGAAFFFVGQAANVMHPALDALAKIELSERSSHSELLKIRALGTKAVPDLRRVLREKDSRRTQFLLWLKGKWPRATNYISDFPDPRKLDERRWTACHAIQLLGRAGRTAAPELIRIFEKGGPRDWNPNSGALRAIGIDAEISEELSKLLEKGVPDNVQPQIIWMLGKVKPPSSRTLRVLGAALKHRSPWVQAAAANVIEGHGITTPEILLSLNELHSTATHKLVFVSSSSALWALEKDKGKILERTLKMLEAGLVNHESPDPGGDHGGGFIGETEDVFIKACDLFAGMPLTDEERLRALDLMERFCAKSGRIFVRMLLLPSMMQLGFARDKGLEVCRTGLGYKEDYYRIQAVRLLADIAAKHSVEEINLDELLRDEFDGVRVHAAKAHWLKKQQASEVLPVLIEALNRGKHQSYYYPEIQETALTVLGAIGPQASSAVIALEELKGDPDPAVAQRAAETLKRIQP